MEDFLYWILALFGLPKLLKLNKLDFYLGKIFNILSFTRLKLIDLMLIIGLTFFIFWTMTKPHRGQAMATLSGEQFFSLFFFLYVFPNYFYQFSKTEISNIGKAFALFAIGIILNSRYVHFQNQIEEAKGDLFDNGLNSVCEVLIYGSFVWALIYLILFLKMIKRI